MKVSLRSARAQLCAGAGVLAVAAVPVGMAVASGGQAAAGPGFQARALKAFKAELARSVAPGRRDRRLAPRSVSGTTQVSYYNWSGYADSSSTPQEFSAVSGKWIVPTATCTSEDRITATWVGLDGFLNGTVEQDGTSEQCFQGTAFYYSWYEMYPSGSIVVASTVKPGDKITASVKRTGTSYALKVTDSTTSGNNISVTKTCALATCTDESAEWIGERPVLSTTGMVPLAQYKPALSFTSASETAGGTTQTISTGPSPNQIFMIDSTGNYELATPSSLNSTGNAFTDTWHNSY